MVKIVNIDIAFPIFFLETLHLTCQILSLLLISGLKVKALIHHGCSIVWVISFVMLWLIFTICFDFLVLDGSWFIMLLFGIFFPCAQRINCDHLLLVVTLALSNFGCDLRWDTTCNWCCRHWHNCIAWLLLCFLLSINVNVRNLYDWIILDLLFHSCLSRCTITLTLVQRRFLFKRILLVSASINRYLSSVDIIWLSRWLPSNCSYR